MGQRIVLDSFKQCVPFSLLEKNLNLPKSFNIRTDAFGDNDAAPIEILEIILKAMKLKTDNKQQTA